MKRTGLAHGADPGCGDARFAPAAPWSLVPVPEARLDRAVVTAAVDRVVPPGTGRPLQLWVHHGGTTVDIARGELARPQDPTRVRRVRPWTRHAVGALVTPAVALATLAALDAHGLPVEHDAVGPTVADVLCGRDRTVTSAQLLAEVAGEPAADAVRDLVAAPLGVAEELALVGDGGVASARALGSVLAAWSTLTRGAPHPRLCLPRPGSVRRAWSRASHVVARAEPDGGPGWYGPGVCRNIGGRLSHALSPTAFGARQGTVGLVVCEPDLDLTLAVVVAPRAEREPAASHRRGSGDDELPRRLVDAVVRAVLCASPRDVSQFDRAGRGGGA